jgi:hypothetical protein
VDEQRKRAYRWLLYRAALEIRPLRWLGTSWRERFNPISRWHNARRAVAAGALADWLHNLALFSALDFEHFDEDRFWTDHKWFEAHYPWLNLRWYREEFERELTSGKPA